MPDSHPDDGFDLTKVDVQSVDVRALQAELARLRGENSRLRAQLDGTSRAGAVEATPSGVPTSSESVESSLLSPRARVELFRRLFRGRTDTFPIRWHSATSGKSGYAPACSNEWVPGVCEKPRVKCAECENRKFIALSDQVIYEHLTGKLTAGVLVGRCGAAVQLERGRAGLRATTFCTSWNMPLAGARAGNAETGVDDPGKLRHRAMPGGEPRSSARSPSLGALLR